MASFEKRQAILDAIVALAEEIARASPDCADRALKIAQLASELEPGPDASTVEDAIAAETADTDLSDTQVRSTTRAVVDALKGAR